MSKRAPLTIPINDDLGCILAAHRTEFMESFGPPLQEHFLFAWGSPVPSDPTRHTISIKHGWESRRRRAGVVFATRLAENGVAEDVGSNGPHEPGHAGTVLAHPNGCQGPRCIGGEV